MSARTKHKYISYRIVVDAEDERLSGLESCPSFSALNVGHPMPAKDGKPPYQPRACSCGAFRVQLNWPPPVKRCDECLRAKEL